MCAEQEGRFEHFREAFVKSLEKLSHKEHSAEAIVFMTHEPAYDTAVDNLGGMHTGSFDAAMGHY